LPRTPGFLVNRLGFPFMMNAIRMLDEAGRPSRRWTGLDDGYQLPDGPSR